MANGRVRSVGIWTSFPSSGRVMDAKSEPVVS